MTRKQKTADRYFNIYPLFFCLKRNLTLTHLYFFYKSLIQQKTYNTTPKMNYHAKAKHHTDKSYIRYKYTF